MNWLKSFGEAVKIGAMMIPAFGPLVAAIIPGSKDDRIIAKATDGLSDLGEIVKQTEIFGAALSLGGADKLKGAVPAISQVIMRSAIMGGLPPGDRALYDQGVIELTNGLVKILNSRAE